MELVNLLRYAEENHNRDICLYDILQISGKRNFSTVCVSLSGKFPKNCQDKSVPTALLSFVNMILNGSSVQEKSSAI